MAEWIQMVGSDDDAALPTLMPATFPPKSMNADQTNGLIHGEADSQPSNPSTLTSRQEKILSLLFVLSALLSTLGSLVIIVKVLYNRSKATSYDRLMLGLSWSDIVASFNCAMQPFLLPSDTSRRVWAVGNDATCKFLGFLTQLSFAAVLYNGVLSYHYLLAVRFGWKRQRIARYETIMHFSAILFPVATALLGLAFDVFHEVDVGFGSWTANYPEGCEGDECTAHIWGYVFGMPIIFSFGSLLINNFIIYHYVRTNLNTMSSPECQSRGKDDRSYLSPSTKRSADELRKAHVREVASQGFLYVGTFLFSYWSPLALRLMGHSITELDDATVFPLLVIQSICWPLQGFFNMLVYVRPSYVRVRAASPGLSQWASMRQAVFESNIPRLSDSTSPADKMEASDFRTRTADDPMEFSSADEQCSEGAPIGYSSTRGMTMPSFFQQLPQEYYNACVQSVLSASERSTRRYFGMSSSLEIVDEESPSQDFLPGATGECDSTTTYRGLEGGTSIQPRVQEENNELSQSQLSDRMTTTTATDQEDSKEADGDSSSFRPNDEVEEDVLASRSDRVVQLATAATTVLVVNGSINATNASLSSSTPLAAVSRSFRIRMDGLVQDKSPPSDGEEKEELPTC